MRKIKSFKLNSKVKKFFRNEGYIIVRNFFDKNEIHQLKKIIFDNFKYINKIEKLNYKSFDKKLIIFRKKNKEKFGTFFDSLQTIGLGYSILTKKKFLTFISSLLETKNNSLTFTDMSLRLDPPYDERNSLGWHQDSSYFRQNNFGKNGAVVWIPLSNLNLESGPLELLRFSNRLGPLNIKKKKSKSKQHSSKRDIDPKLLEGYDEIIRENLKIGDAIITDLDLVHRSGKNLSNKFRMSLIGRYHKLLSRDFNSGLNKYLYTDKKLNREVHGE